MINTRRRIQFTRTWEQASLGLTVDTKVRALDGSNDHKPFYVAF